MFDPLSSLTQFALPRLTGFVRYPPPFVAGAGIARARTLAGPELTVELLSRPAPPLELTDAYYSPSGLLFKGRTAYAHGSIQTPTPALLRQAFRQRRNTTGTLDHGTVLGMQHPMSYGDWFRQGFLFLCSRNIQPPVLLPQKLFSLPFIRRDAQRLGITLRPVPFSGLYLRKATAHYPDGGFFEWLPKDIAAIRAALHISPPSPAPGSLLYLSREGEPKSGVDRTYPSLLVEEIVRARGGRVIRTVNTTLQDYLALAPYAHTVIADHGAAMCNLTWWQTTRVIEIQTTHCNDFFITLAAAAGVLDYMLLRLHNLDSRTIQSQINSALEMPLGR